MHVLSGMLVTAPPCTCFWDTCDDDASSMQPNGQEIILAGLSPAALRQHSGSLNITLQPAQFICQPNATSNKFVAEASSNTNC